jgi:hypothetical protein
MFLIGKRQCMKLLLGLTVASSTCHIVCILETKFESVSQFDARFLDGNHMRSFIKHQAIGLREECSSYGMIQSKAISYMPA